VTSVFISYSRRDKGFVQRLHDALSERDYEVWVDWEDIPPSSEWVEEIRTGVRSADGFIYVISPESVASEQCEAELDRAVEQRKRILPILHREPDGKPVPEAAASLNWVYLRDSDDFDAGLAQLVAAIETDLEHVRTHTRIGVEAARWEASNGDRSLLLRGSDLAAAEGWLVGAAGKEPGPTQLQREYLLASRQAATRRQRTVIGAVSIALVVAVVLAVVALVQRSTAIHERNVADARLYDGEAQQLASSQPVVGLQVAEAAVKLAPSTVTTDALRQSLEQSLERVRIFLNPDSASPVAGDAIWSPDGTRLLVTSPGPGPGQWARIYRPGASSPSVTLAGGAAPSGQGESGWDARGDRVILGGGRPAVYNALTGGLIMRIPGTATHAALNADGSIAVTVDINSVGHVFDVATGRELATFHPRFGGGVTCFALSPTGDAVAQCDSQGAVGGSSRYALDTWSTRTGKLIHSVPRSTFIDGVAFNSDGSQYAFSGGTTTNPKASLKAIGAPGTFVYDAHTGKLLASFNGGSSAIAFGPKGELAWADLGDDNAQLYNFNSGLRLTLSGASDVIGTISFSPDGDYVVVGAGGSDNSARVYYAIGGGQPLETLSGHSSEIREASFGDHDRWIATSSRDGTVREWVGPASTPTLRTAPQPGNADIFVQSLGFSATGEQIYEASANGQGRILDARNLRVLSRFAAPLDQGFAGAVESRDQRVVVALSGPYDAASHRLLSLTTAETYNAGSGRLIATMTPQTPGGLFNASIDRAGDKLVTLGFSGAADEWNPRTGRLLHHLPGTNIAAAAVFSQDGSQLAILHYPLLPKTVDLSTVFAPITIDIYNADTGALEHSIASDKLTPQVPGEKLYSPLNVAFSPDGNLLAVGGAADDVEIYNPHTGALVRTLGISGASVGDYANSLAFSPNGRLLAIGAATGATVWRIPATGGYFTAIPQPFVLVPAGSFPSINGNGFGMYVGFTEDSRYLVMSGDDAVAAWDLSSRLQLFRASPVAKGVMSSQSNEFVTAGGAGVSVYSCGICGGTNELLKVAKQETTAPLTPSDKLTYLSQG
jgi:WD40 repeat protein